MTILESHEYLEKKTLLENQSFLNEGALVKLMSNLDNLDFPHCHKLRSNLRVIKDLGGPN